MNVALWVVQVILAALFVGAGVIKSTQPKDKIEAKLAWSADFSTTTVRFIGAVEFLAALGLILPAFTGIAVILTPLAAAGLAVIMLLAVIVHVRRKEYLDIVVNLVLLALAGFVAWGRFGPYAF